MRHPERKLTDEETLVGLLERTTVGRVATINREGFPVIKPINFLYWEGKIFFHSSLRGEKMRDIRRGSPICFEIDDPVAFVTSSGSSCKASYCFRSIIVKGRATLIKSGNKKLEVLSRMMEKYQPEGEYNDLSAEMLRRTALVQISVEEITGKENLG